MKWIVAVAVLCLNLAVGLKATSHKLTVPLKNCSKVDKALKNGYWEVDNLGESIEFWCRKGFRLKRKKNGPQYLECVNNLIIGNWPRCRPRKVKTAKSMIKSLINQHHHEIQADEARGSGGEEIPDHWIPYGNDIAREDEDEIVILETQDGEKIKETGKYNTRSENQDPDLKKQYVDEDAEEEYDEEEKEDQVDEDVDNYGDYNPDYENEGSARPSGDYGQYYDYNYEGSGSDYKQNIGIDDTEYAEDNTGGDDPMIEEEQQQEDPEITEEQHAEGLATTDAPATNDDSLETNETEAQTNEGAKDDYDDSDDDYKEPEEEDYVEQDEYEEEEDESERERIETEEELLYRNYEILSDFYKKHFVDLRVLDTSCVPEKVPPPSIANGGVKEYQTVENVLLPGKRYHEVIYQCDQGYKLSDSSLGHMFCQQQGWMGVQPYCEEDPNAASSATPKAMKDCQENTGCEHLCKLVDGRAVCFCNEGYDIYDVTSCVDIDECADGNGGCSHSCINKPGTYTCECPKGYSASGGDCLDINECVANNGHGPCQDTCINKDGGYECTCENLEGTELQEDGHKCSGVDLCAENNGGCSHECYTTYGQSFCMCPAGYKLDEDWKTCVDVNECATMASVRESCANGCENTIGSYRCMEQADLESVESRILCDSGYEFNEESNECVDIDDCSEEPCGANGQCMDKVNAYSCDCNKGFSFDGTTCVDIDECAEDELRCGEGICENHLGSFDCICNPGYELREAICQDIDECTGDKYPCDQGVCQNIPGSFVCDCEEGYEFKNGVCQDIDECLSDESLCDFGSCKNLPGSYECICEQGFEFREGRCEDIDECAQGSCQNGKCSNWEGSFDCECDIGFQWSEETRQCEDIDECSHQACGRAQCENTIGSFNCLCRGNRVYNIAQRKCQRLNPCKQNPELCGAHGYCNMVRSGFECRCDPGFESNGTVCMDVDECAIDNGGCKHKCENSQGSFQCICESGYQINPNDPRICIDVDECAELEDTCNQNCINTIGSFRCDCSEGYVIDPEDPKNCQSGSECSDECSFQCKNGKCICPEGFVLDSDMITCIKESPKFDGCAPLPHSDGMALQCSNEPENEVYERGTICRGKCIQGYIAMGRLKQKCRRDGTWSGSDGSCRQVFCPPLELAPHVQVRPESCSLEPSLVRQRCKFSCEDGFNLVGSRATRCRRNNSWKHNGGPPKCTPEARMTNALSFVPLSTTSRPYSSEVVGSQESYEDKGNLSPTSYTEPYVYCPPDIVRDLPADSATIYVRIPQPKTNVNWYDFVKATPKWAKSLEGQLGLGKTLITFQALSPITEESASCSFTVYVKDTVPPRVYNCPNDFNVYLDEGQEKRQVFWEEPIFADNVKIKHVMASKMPGQLFEEGKHNVLYQASDDDGNQANCRFVIKVYPAQQLEIRRRKWVICRVGTTGRLIKLFVAHVPRGCWVLPQIH
ncbi:fibrillin-2-like [Tigriopus californicus]|uniref:fibrillin-2-like n=1 Tax=Tigriopus californicus TaxID=6832 RepID=UPI0027DA31F0|nr:fibrillin-2-like [Tigriopus californicus]XP_059084979.1 fibrillin-2-like [Tigriopus californicus]|eukprot:TCALIF_09991-PA protein Name:"Similar to LTBP2 Latent-transforming growth factor beta-binding protein 2 (Homo sapiens)" AED:0.02 eAED:0.02 QI:103/1/0.66/1/0.8/0.83/6/74/1451